MKTIGIRELRRHLTSYVQGSDVIFITKHGRLTSLMIPLDKPENIPVELKGKLLESIGEAIQKHLK